MDWMMTWMGGWMVLLWIVFLLAIVAGTILLARALRANEPHRSATTRDAVSILEERYARGEIDRDEFQERHQALTS